MASRPSTYINWTDGSPTKVTQPTNSQQLSGWTIGEPPPFQYMNWLFYILDLWVQWFDQSNTNPSKTLITNAQSPYSVVPADENIFSNSAGGNNVVTLPAIATSDGRQIFIKNLGGANHTTVSGDANIDGDASSVLANYDGITVQAVNGQWWYK